MRPCRLHESLTIRITSPVRECIEKLASEEEAGIGEITRELIDAGIKARGLKC